MKLGNLGARLGLVMCALFLLAVWQFCWFPDLSRCYEADLGIFSAGMLASANLLGSAFMATIVQARLILFEEGTPYLKAWYAGTLVGITTILGLVQWFLVGKLVGRFLQRYQTRRASV